MSYDVAKEFALGFLKCQSEHWGSAETVVRYHLLAKALKIGLQEKILTLEDLFQDDAFVLEKLERSELPDILNILTLLRGEIEYEITTYNPTIVTKKKFRYVDPLFLKEGKLYLLSDADETYPSLIEQHQQINQKGISIRLPAVF